MVESSKKSALRGEITTIDIFDSAEMRVIARFPYVSTDDLDFEVAVRRARLFAKSYCSNTGFSLSQFCLIDKRDNTVWTID